MDGNRGYDLLGTRLHCEGRTSHNTKFLTTGNS